MYITGLVWVFCFFFFQAEDGIRDIGVTGVQTCALPIKAILKLFGTENYKDKIKFWQLDFVIEKYKILCQRLIFSYNPTNVVIASVISMRAIDFLMLQHKLQLTQKTLIF